MSIERCHGCPLRPLPGRLNPIGRQAPCRRAPDVRLGLYLRLRSHLSARVDDSHGSRRHHVAAAHHAHAARSRGPAVARERPALHALLEPRAAEPRDVAMP